MQYGSGEHARSQPFTVFSDYSVAIMQRYFENRMVKDASFASGYRRWDTDSSQWVAAEVDKVKFSGQNSLDQVPQKTDVPVHAVVIAMSYVGTQGATRIYPPISFVGNLRRQIDPTVKSERDSVSPSAYEGGVRGIYYNFCIYGCDYSLRATYVDGTSSHFMLKDSFRSFGRPTDPVPAEVLDPHSYKSFRTWALNIPGNLELERLELLETPMAWRGISDLPCVITQWQRGG